MLEILKYLYSPGSGESLGPDDEWSEGDSDEQAENEEFDDFIDDEEHPDAPQAKRIRVELQLGPREGKTHHFIDSIYMSHHSIDFMNQSTFFWNKVLSNQIKI